MNTEYNSHKLLVWTLVTIVLVAIVNYAASALYLYWTIWWFDNVVHFSGGLAMGFLTYWLFRKLYPVIQPLGIWKLILILLVFVMIIGVGWEIFEYIFNTALPSAGETYIQDTCYDLISDALGAVAAAVILYKSKLNG
jgi:uncharacterized membrane protein YjdF